MKNQREAIDEILVKYIAGAATEEERGLALKWIYEDENHKRHFDEIKDIYEVSGINYKNPDNTDLHWEKLKAKYYQRKFDVSRSENLRQSRQLLRVQLLRVAAIFVIAFFSGMLCFYIFKYKYSKAEQISYNEVLAPLGSKTTIILAEGTKVCLNSGSKLRYPVNFSKSSRDVYLEGEAYFNVVKQSGKKFVVHTSCLNIKVLGTEFNVKAYPEEQTIETTLVKGLITIGNGDHSKKQIREIFLKPNQQAKFKKGDLSIAVTSVNEKNNIKKQEVEATLEILPKINPVIYTSWKDRRWIIQGEELQSLAIKLERRYDVKIIFENESLKNYKFSGTLSDETLEQVLNIIKVTAPINYSIENKTVRFIANKLSKEKYDKMLINH